MLTSRSGFSAIDGFSFTKSFGLDDRTVSEVGYSFSFVLDDGDDELFFEDF